MSILSKNLRAFIKECNEKIATERAGERTFYHAIENLIVACGEKIRAHVELSGDEKGIPDIHVFRSKNKIGIVEVKDLDVSIEEIENSYELQKEKNHNEEQFEKYLNEYPNLIYTNIHEWRRYRNHNPKPVQIARIASLGADGKLHFKKDSFA